jgi:hypothetical protein
VNGREEQQAAGELEPSSKPLTGLVSAPALGLRTGDVAVSIIWQASSPFGDNDNDVFIQPLFQEACYPVKAAYST